MKIENMVDDRWFVCFSFPPKKFAKNSCPNCFALKLQSELSSISYLPMPNANWT